MMLEEVDWRGTYMVVIEPDSTRWFNRIDEICMTLPNICFQNVFREANEVADILAKSGVDRRSAFIASTDFDPYADEDREV
ncbi:hypothetical protein GQ457_17G003010 [Hibiscus cannabinus]